MRRRFGADVVLAVVLPLACALALLLLHPDRGQPHGSGPAQTPLTTASVVCPAALAGTGADLLAVSSPAAGSVQVGLGATAAPLQLRAGKVATAAPGAGPAVVTASGESAPGLVAGRSQSAPLAAVDCAPPVPDQWFTGVGADATHGSVVELVNPHAGPAVADIIVRSPSGAVEVPALRGVTVPGQSAATLDLGQIVPNRAELALEVHTSRGSLAVHVVDAVDQLGNGASSQDWLPSQAAPASSSLLLGLAAGDGDRTLVLANPGGDEVRATIKVVTAASTFEPTGVEAVRVAPDSTEAVSLGDVLAQATKDGAIGLLVEADGPVTAGLRQLVGGDLSDLAGLPAVGAATSVVLPAGPKQLLLAGATTDTPVSVSAFNANGKLLDQHDDTLAAGAALTVAVPDGAVLVTLTPQGPVHGAVQLTGGGTAVVPLREPVLTGLVPDVRPGVP